MILNSDASFELWGVQNGAKVEDILKSRRIIIILAAVFIDLNIFGQIFHNSCAIIITPTCKRTLTAMVF